MKDASKRLETLRAILFKSLGRASLIGVLGLAAVANCATANAIEYDRTYDVDKDSSEWHDVSSLDFSFKKTGQGVLTFYNSGNPEPLNISHPFEVIDGNLQIIGNSNLIETAVRTNGIGFYTVVIGGTLQQIPFQPNILFDGDVTSTATELDLRGNSTATFTGSFTDTSSSFIARSGSEFDFQKDATFTSSTIDLISSSATFGGDSTFVNSSLTLTEGSRIDAIGDAVFDNSSFDTRNSGAAGYSDFNGLSFINGSSAYAESAIVSANDLRVSSGSSMAAYNSSVTAGSVSLSGDSTLVVANGSDVHASGNFTIDNSKLVVMNDSSASGYSMTFGNGAELEMDRSENDYGVSLSPTVSANNLRFDAGSKLSLNARANGSASPTTIGTISAGTLSVSEDAEIWYDGISTLPTDAKVALNVEMEEFDAFNESGSSDMTLKDFLTPKSGLVNVKSVGSSYILSTKNLEDYARENGGSQAETTIARQMDAQRLAKTDVETYDKIYNTGGYAVADAVQNVKTLAFNPFATTTHFGNPTSAFFSPFFAESSLSGVKRRGQSNHENLDAAENGNVAPQRSALGSDASWEQEENERNKTLWGSYLYASIDGKDYDDGLTNTFGYEMRRQGVIGGIRRQIDGTTSCGLFFGLTKPISKSKETFVGGDYGFSSSKIKIDDFQFAGHFEKVFMDVFEAAFFVGGGTQRFDWERNVVMTRGGLWGHEASGTGNTLTATAYLSHRIDVSDRLKIRPTIGVDSEHSWLYGYSETVNAVGDRTAVDREMQMFANSYHYDQSYYNRNTGRAGASISWQGAQGFAGFTARAFYGCQLGGKSAPRVSAYSNCDVFNDAARQMDVFTDLETHRMGRESLAIGGGGYAYLNAEKTLSINGEINQLWYKNAETRNIAGGLSWLF